MVQNKEQHNAKTKKLAIKYYLKKEISQEKVSEIFNVNPRTFRRWLEAYNNNEKLDRPKRQNKSYKTKRKHVDYAIKLVNKNPTWSIKLLWSNIKDKYDDFEITQTQLSRVIRDNNITRKRTTTRHYPETRYNKKINFKEEMKSFYQKVDKFSLSKIISVDETSIHAEITASYSRCDLGKRCVKKTSNNKVFRKFTLVCAISKKGIVGWELYEKGGMTSDRMVNFINKNIKGKYKKNLIIMDNGGAHKSKNIKECVLESNNMLLYSVPYRPKTNAIESWFNQFKHYFRLSNNGAITYNELKEKVKISIGKIPKKSYSNYILYSYKTKEIRTYEPKKSTRRRKLKEYID